MTETLLSHTEIVAAIEVLSRRGTEPRRRLWRNHAALFCLVTCCGLTAPEIAAVRLVDCHFRDPGSQDHIAFGQRIIPLTWCEPAREVLRSHYAFSLAVAHGDRQAPFLCGLRQCNFGKPMSTSQIYNSYSAACRVAGVREHVHLVSQGVDSFVANALAAGVEPAQIRAIRGQLLPDEPKPTHKPTWHGYADVLGNARMDSPEMM